MLTCKHVDENSMKQGYLIHSLNETNILKWVSSIVLNPWEISQKLVCLSLFLLELVVHTQEWNQLVRKERYLYNPINGFV